MNTDLETKTVANPGPAQDSSIPEPKATNRQSIKIVRVIARLNVGGPAKHVAWLTAGLQDQDWETLLVAGSVPPGEEDMSYFAASLGVRPLLLKEMSREISLKDALTIWKLYRLFKREKPDLVCTHTAKAGTVGRSAGLLYRWLTPATLIGRPRRCYFVHTYHGHVFHGYYGRTKSRVFLLIEKLLARLITDRIIVISNQQRQEIHDVFGVGRADQFVVIPLGLDLGAFAEPQKRRESFRAELGIKPEEILVGIVGRLTEIKNHELFLQGVARFKSNQSSSASNSRVKFVVLGDGSLREQLEKRAQALGVAGDVIFAGSRKDPENFYAGLDVVALTSKNEGTPLTLIEAMANRIPVISTGVGGVVDLLGEVESETPEYQVCRRGLSITPNDPVGFAAGVRRLVDDADLRGELGSRGLEFVTQNYSHKRLIADIRALYSNLTPFRGSIPNEIHCGNA
jgi:glycosyltransferase involved in cell wall biosynthesis